MTELKEILEFVKSDEKGKNWIEIRKKFGWNNDDSRHYFKKYFGENSIFFSVYSILTKGGNIDTWKISEEGKNFLKQNSLKNKFLKYLKMNILPSLIVGIIVAGFSVWYTNITTESLTWPNFQTLYFKEPELVEFPIQSMTTKELIHNSPFIDICIINSAKMKTGYIHFKLIGENLTSSDGQIDNIESMDMKCGYPKIRHKDCSSDNCPVNVYSVPNGIRKLVFQFECNQCKPTFVFNKTFNVCLFRESNLECKK